MWVRRIDIQLGEPTKMFWRHAHPAIAALVDQHNAFGESNRDHLHRAVLWLDAEISDGRLFIAGDLFTIAYITALTIIDFAELIGLDPLAGAEQVRQWHAGVSVRPSTNG